MYVVQLIIVHDRSILGANVFNRNFCNAFFTFKTIAIGHAFYPAF